MPGKLVHTNEITVLLGDNWFSKCSAKQAIELVEHRKKRMYVSEHNLMVKIVYLVLMHKINDICAVLFFFLFGNSQMEVPFRSSISLAPCLPSLLET